MEGSLTSMTSLYLFQTQARYHALQKSLLIAQLGFRQYEIKYQIAQPILNTIDFYS